MLFKHRALFHPFSSSSDASLSSTHSDRDRINIGEISQGPYKYMNFLKCSLCQKYLELCFGMHGLISRLLDLELRHFSGSYLTTIQILLLCSGFIFANMLLSLDMQLASKHSFRRPQVTSQMQCPAIILYSASSYTRLLIATSWSVLRENIFSNDLITLVA